MQEIMMPCLSLVDRAAERFRLRVPGRAAQPPGAPASLPGTSINRHAAPHRTTVTDLLPAATLAAVGDFLETVPLLVTTVRPSCGMCHPFPARGLATPAADSLPLGHTENIPAHPDVRKAPASLLHH